MTEKKYSLTYTIKAHEEGLTKEQVMSLGPDTGACDQIIIHSCVKRADGNMSTMIVSHDGTTSMELPPEELFSAWVLLAEHLASTLPEGTQRATVHEAMTRAMKTYDT
jgi:hypothetical protein